MNGQKVSESKYTKVLLGISVVNTVLLLGCGYLVWNLTGDLMVLASRIDPNPMFQPASKK